MKQSNYTWRALAGDTSGGVMAALIAIPYGLAMATMMGLPPVLGLFTSIVTAPITALLGPNPVLIGGTASATVPFIAAAVASQGVGGAAKVTMVASVFLIIFSVLQLGRYITKVPHAVVSGFSCGVGAMMVLSQLRTLTGVASLVDPASSNTILGTLNVLGKLDAFQHVPFIIGLLVVIGSFAAARYSSRIPAPLAGLIFALIVVTIFGLKEREVGALPLKIPPFAGFSWAPSDVYSVLPSALALAFVTSINLLITSRVVEHFQGRHRPLKPSAADKELGAYGIANLCAGIFGAPLSVGIPARSLANVRCGGSTRVSNLIHAIAIIAFLGIGVRFLEHVPIAALAGVIVYIGICLLDWSAWRRLTKMRRLDAAAFLTTAIAVLVVNAVAAVAAGTLIYAIPSAYRKLTTSAALRPAAEAIE